MTFEDAALEELVRRSQGYPYFLQEWGYHVWNAACKSPVTRQLVIAAAPEVSNSWTRTSSSVASTG